MGDKSKIDWTDATWNPVTGCTHVSPGCDHCYAASLASGRLKEVPAYKGLAVDGEFTGEIRLLPDRLMQPIHWARPRRIFVNSMSDLFHSNIPREYLAKVFAVMAVAKHHQFQILTKRAGVMRAILNSPEFGELVLHEWGKMHLVTHGNYPLNMDGKVLLPNVWLGVSAESQKWAELRIPALVQTPAAVKFVSAEPLLGPIDLFGNVEEHGPAVTREGVMNLVDYGTGIEWDVDDQLGIDWVIVGGESGSKARPMHPDWARSLRDQCVKWKVAFHFKQWGEWAPVTGYYNGEHRQIREWPENIHYWGGSPNGGPVSGRVGKRAAGRVLDGQTWDQWPDQDAYTTDS
jgi:protein gp37